MAETKESAEQAFKQTVARFGDKYPKAINKLVKDEEELLAFYDFPDVHWTHIRTTNPIESTFATVRLRSKRAKNCGSRETTLAMVYKLLETAQKRWRRIQGFNLLTLVVNNVIFKDGKQEDEQSTEKAAWMPYTRFDNNSRAQLDFVMQVDIGWSLNWRFQNNQHSKALINILPLPL